MPACWKGAWSDAAARGDVPELGPDAPLRRTRATLASPSAYSSGTGFGEPTMSRLRYAEIRRFSAPSSEFT